MSSFPFFISAAGGAPDGPSRWRRKSRDPFALAQSAAARLPSPPPLRRFRSRSLVPPRERRSQNQPHRIATVASKPPWTLPRTLRPPGAASGPLMRPESL